MKKLKEAASSRLKKSSSKAASKKKFDDSGRPRLPKIVADMIKGKTSEEIHKSFNIKNVFTPEEEEEWDLKCPEARHCQRANRVDYDFAARLEHLLLFACSHDGFAFFHYRNQVIHHSIAKTATEYDEHGDEEYFKRDDVDASSPSTEELVQAFSIDCYPVRMQCNGAADLTDPKVINRIKMELFGATTITTKIILEGGLVVVDGLSGDGAAGGGSGSAVGANDAPIIVFKASHYEYDHTGYTDFASPSECSACKCQDCRAKHDVAINDTNALIASVKKFTSKRDLIPSKRILFPSALLEIRVERRRRVISRILSSIQKVKLQLSVCVLH
ncbi:hypothetical protein CQW23_28189 [Capsicum baccatum]|uniref:SKP1 component dimerisation domain-containing protein n=1 Tax=Capsicum baccatum TaxID=33114 RepID=A0A2G2VFU6_CAPBA|nr:hypothetical protein CQW23_28189 [Capsicum baccatum]